MIVKALVGLVSVAAIAYAALCAVLFFAQRSMIYMPSRGPFRFDSEVIKLATPAGEVRVSVKQQGGPDAVIYFGGNAEDVWGSMPDLTAAFPDASIYLLHYRGYGGSAGKPTEVGIRQDAIALYDRVKGAHAEITIVGRSLGSGVAVWLASQRPPSRLILVTPFNSLQEIAARQFPCLPVTWLMLDKYESWRYAPQITAPTLTLQAENDEVVPSAGTRALATHFRKGVVTLQIIPGVGHNTLSLNPENLRLPEGFR
jgi:uncharacterized protein